MLAAAVLSTACGSAPGLPDPSPVVAPAADPLPGPGPTRPTTTPAPTTSVVPTTAPTRAPAAVVPIETEPPVIEPEPAVQRAAGADLAPVQPAAPVEEPEPVVRGGCNDNYDPCVPDDPKDVDCEGGSGNGPSYVDGPVRVVGDDVYGLDADDDGIGCE